jgi:hypothetical protein
MFIFIAVLTLFEIREGLGSFGMLSHCVPTTTILLPFHILLLLDFHLLTLFSNPVQTHHPKSNPFWSRQMPQRRSQNAGLSERRIRASELQLFIRDLFHCVTSLACDLAIRVLCEVDI